MIVWGGYDGFTFMIMAGNTIRHPTLGIGIHYKCPDRAISIPWFGRASEMIVWGGAQCGSTCIVYNSGGSITRHEHLIPTSTAAGVPAGVWTCVGLDGQ